MTDFVPVGDSEYVPWSTQDPNAPSDLSGWAWIPRKRVVMQMPDPFELEKRLRDLTPDFPIDPVERREAATKLRDELIVEGGRPTRPVQTFDVSQAHPESVSLYGVEHGLYELYADEVDYWEEELKSWRGFIENRRQNFSLEDADQTQVFMEYLAYQKEKIQNFDRRPKPRKGTGLAVGLAWKRKGLIKRLNVIRQQLANIQNEQQSIMEPLSVGTSEPAAADCPPPSKPKGSIIPRRSSRLAEKTEKKRKKALHSSATLENCTNSRIAKPNRKTKHSGVDKALPHTSKTYPRHRSTRSTVSMSRALSGIVQGRFDRDEDLFRVSMGPSVNPFAGLVRREPVIIKKGTTSHLQASQLPRIKVCQNSPANADRLLPRYAISTRL